MRKIKQRKLYKLVEVLPHLFVSSEGFNTGQPIVMRQELFVELAPQLHELGYGANPTPLRVKALIQYSGKAIKTEVFAITPNGVVQVSEGVLPKFILDEIAEALWVNLPHWKRRSTHAEYAKLADIAIKFLEKSAKAQHEHHDHNAN